MLEIIHKYTQLTEILKVCGASCSLGSQSYLGFCTYHIFVFFSKKKKEKLNIQDKKSAVT